MNPVSRMIRVVLLGLAIAGAIGRSPPVRADDDAYPRYDQDYPDVRYGANATHNAVARLIAALSGRQKTLRFQARRGYLDSVLAALDINPASQVLVFSKTALHQELVGPETPRAIYFNEDTYVAWIPGSDRIEITTIDAERGPVFYILPNKDDSAARFERQNDACLSCHDTYSLSGGGIPRVMDFSSPVRGRMTSTDEPAIEVSDATPLENRFGGWYVTGKWLKNTHLGNLPLPTSGNFPEGLAGRAEIASLKDAFDTTAYLCDRSDIVAQMVLVHQATVHNLITRVQFRTRGVVARTGASMDAASGWKDLGAKQQAAIKPMLEHLVQALTFADMPPLKGEISGASSFAEPFLADARRDPDGRSLKDLDLKAKFFRYCVSYLIYSDAFAALPRYARDYVYRRLPASVESCKDNGRATLDILEATDPDFKAFVAPAAAPESQLTRKAATLAERVHSTARQPKAAFSQVIAEVARKKPFAAVGTGLVDVGRRLVPGFECRMSAS